MSRHVLASSRTVRGILVPNSQRAGSFQPSLVLGPVFSPSYQPPPNPRTFTNLNSQLLLVGRQTLRPQLPFLHPSAALPKVTLQSLESRFISTARKESWRRQWRVQWWFHSRLWPALFLIYLMFTGIGQAKLEREWPTPREWSFYSRWVARSAKGRENDEDSPNGVPWMLVASLNEEVIRRLEDRDIDGGSLLGQGGPMGGEEIDVVGVGRTGWDISMKSEPWRRGYYEALMSSARASEHLEGMVRVKNRKDPNRLLCWPKECVKSASNPKPRAMPFGLTPCPSEELVEAAAPDPKVWYMRILTTKGFSNRQRLDAAVAYADWLDFKGLSETAESMYDWALDIAAGGLPVGADAVVDMKTGVLSSSKSQFVSDNLLKATTALAVHHAQLGNVKAALPIFLSVLKARKELPAAPLYQQTTKEKDKTKEEGLWAYIYGLRDWVIDAPYPPRVDDGDSQPYHTLKEACEEVGLMTYIGEILYATSSKEKGLSWTRDAVDAAEAVMWVMDEEKKRDGKEKCRQCLETSLDNWKKMAKSMAIAAEMRELNAVQNPGWIPGERDRAHQEAKRWQEEEAQIVLKKEKTMPLINPLKPTPASWLSV